MRPELLILDYGLPDMTGLEIVTRLASRSNPPAALLVTGHILSSGARRAAESFGVKVFQKPVSPEDVLEGIRSAVR